MTRIEYDDLIFHLRKLSGVGRQSAPALIKNDSCPAGSAATIRFHIGQSTSSTIISHRRQCGSNRDRLRSLFDHREKYGCFSGLEGG